MSWKTCETCPITESIRNKIITIELTLCDRTHKLNVRQIDDKYNIERDKHSM